MKEYISISLKEKQNFIVLYIKKNLDHKEQQAVLADYIKQTVFDIYKENPGERYKILFDLTNTDRHFNFPPKEVLSDYYEITDHDQTEKIAVKGNSKLEELVLNVLFSRLKAKKANWFDSREKAMKWLGIE